MGTEENKAVVRDYIDELFNKGNFSLIDELLASNYLEHVAGTQEIHGLEAMEQAVTTYRSAFPDITVAIEDQIAEGDRVASRWTLRGTHQGELAGIPPTGKQVTMTGMEMNRVVNGKVVETWSEFDALGMMQQLGVVPAPEQAGV
jgi:steroid delta-isomerase-like uncharacterized protein